MSRWYLDVIRNFRIAAESLFTPQDDDILTMQRVLVDYLRGAALAIIPDSFDTHRSAAELLEGLRPPIDELVIRATQEEQQAIIREVWAKSRVILSTMYLHDGDTAWARTILEEIEQDPEMHRAYRDWARQQRDRMS
jgi:hypothetical protein